LLSNNTKLSIKDALYSPKSRRNSLSFKDIQANGYHIETIDEDIKEYIYIISCISAKKLVLGKLHAFSSRICYTIMKFIKTNVVIHQKCSNQKLFMLWHDRFGHLRSIMVRQIIENLYGHPLKNQEILLPSENTCAACSPCKLITKPYPSKVVIELSSLHVLHVN
jgi:hypothetical protein